MTTRCKTLHKNHNFPCSNTICNVSIDIFAFQRYFEVIRSQDYYCCSRQLLFFVQNLELKHCFHVFSLNYSLTPSGIITKCEIRSFTFRMILLSTKNLANIFKKNQQSKKSEMWSKKNGTLNRFISKCRVLYHNRIKRVCAISTSFKFTSFSRVKRCPRGP